MTRWFAAPILLLLSLSAASAIDVPPAVDEDGPRAFRLEGVTTGLNLRTAPRPDAAVITVLPPDAVLDHLECRAGRERAWCDVQPLGGGPRGWVAAEFLTPAADRFGAVPRGPDDSALRAGQKDFDATGRVQCDLGAAASDWCDMSVARAGAGDATVVITGPTGRERMLFFRLGRAIGASSSEADRWGEFRSERRGDDSHVRLGDERYTIPDAVIFGG